MPSLRDGYPHPARDTKPSTNVFFSSSFRDGIFFQRSWLGWYYNYD